MNQIADQWLPKDLGYYLKGGGTLIVSQAIDLVFGLLTTYLFTNYSSTEAYGNYGYALSLLSVAALAALPGVDTAILYSAAKGYSGGLRHGTVLRIKTSFIGALGMLVVAISLRLSGRETTAWTVGISALLLPVLQGFSGFASQLQGQARFVEYAITSLVIESGKVIAVLIAVLGLHLDGVPLIAVFLSTLAVLRASVCLGYIRRSHGEPGPEFDTMSRNLSISAVLGTLAQHADRLIVGTFFGLGSMATYNLAVTLTEPLRRFGTVIAKLLFPQVVTKDASAPLFVRKYGLGLTALAAGLIALVAVYWIGFPLVQPLIFSRYADSIPVVRWLIVATALSIFDVLAIQVLWGFRDLRPIYASQIAFPILRIITLGLGARLFGVGGVLAGQVTYYAVMAAMIIGIWLTASARARGRVSKNGGQ